jgi:HD-GYP domain-containing protein (c-di-GMP phosphodiesterase class II)
MGARILAVADIFDALTAHRPYREPMPDEKVVKILREDADAGKLDGTVIDALERVLPRIVKIRNQINRRIRRRKRSLSVLMDVEQDRRWSRHG